jgi:hypothetical protein
MEAAEDFGVLPQIQAREIEEGQQIAVAHIEEEVRRTPVVAILEQLSERELEHVLIERDGPLDVTRQKGKVVQTPGR